MFTNIPSDWIDYCDECGWELDDCSCDEYRPTPVSLGQAQHDSHDLSKFGA